MQLRSRSRSMLYAAVVVAVVLAGAYWMLGGAVAESGAVTHMDPKAFMAAMQADPDAVLVDVRTPEEFNAGHLPGALNVELDRLEALAPRMLPDKNAHLLVYCRSGNRSGFAVQILERMGYTRLVNMTGGIAQWGGMGYPVTQR